MGAFLSHQKKHPLPTPFSWTVPQCATYSISPVFTQESENFVAFVNRDLSQLTIYCCSASQWQYDELFVFMIQLKTETEVVQTSAAFTHNAPFCALLVDSIPETFSISIELCPNYPYTRKARYLGILNSGATCYIATVVQMLFHTESFRQLLYSFKDPPDAPAALQNLFVELQLSSRAPTMDAFIRSLGSFRDLAFVQNDAHEFLIGLLERFETDLGETFTDGVNEIFGGRITKVIRGDDGNMVSESSDDFLAVPVVVEGLRSLSESLTLSTAKEVLEDYDMGDGTRCLAEQRSYFSKLPPVLVFQLCRFAYSKKTNSVIELRNAFDCPFTLNMSDFTKDYDGETEYEMYGITAHSGNPVSGHYTSYFRPHLAEQWVLFNDGVTKNVDLHLIQRLFGTENRSQPSFFKAFSFSSAVAYMLYYVRKDCHRYVAAGEYIPLHLVPHRSNLLFSRFLFSEKCAGEPLALKMPPFEWEDPDRTVLSIVQQLYPEENAMGYNVWVDMPGRSQFIGPLRPTIRASDFVVKGHATTFFLTPMSMEHGPFFLATEKPPRICIAMTDMYRCKEGYKAQYQRRDLSHVQYVLPGSVVIQKSIKNVVLKIQGRRLLFPHDATYNDVQKRLALCYTKPPNRILLLHAGEPMLPIDHPYISSFPAGELDLQFLEGRVTVCSIDLFIQLTLTYVSSAVVHQHNEPFWLQKGKTCQDLIHLVPRIFPLIRQNDTRPRIQVSIGDQTSIEKVLDMRAPPTSQKIRLDSVRYEIVTTRSRLKTVLSKGISMSIEVRFARSKTHCTFEGTSRLISITKKTVYRELREKMMKINGGSASLDRPTCGLILVSEKPKIQMELSDDDNLFAIMKQMTAKMTKQQQRLVVALVAENPLLMNNTAKIIPRSLSGIINQRIAQEAIAAGPPII